MCNKATTRGHDGARSTTWWRVASHYNIIEGATETRKVCRETRTFQLKKDPGIHMRIRWTTKAREKWSTKLNVVNQTTYCRVKRKNEKKILYYRRRRCSGLGRYPSHVVLRILLRCSIVKHCENVSFQSFAPKITALYAPRALRTGRKFVSDLLTSPAVLFAAFYYC